MADAKGVEIGDIIDTLVFRETYAGFGKNPLYPGQSLLRLDVFIMKGFQFE
jgi:hypothetical protein